MRRVEKLWLWCALALACSGESATATTEASATAGTTAMGSDTDATGSTSTGPAATYCENLGGPCEESDSDENCLKTEDASYCAYHRECIEWGPGGIPGRCNEAPHELQSICTWQGDDRPSPCIITCTLSEDCPEEGMVCTPCPEPFETACDSLGSLGGRGPNMCAWPNGA